MREVRDVIARALATRHMTPHIGDHVIQELKREGYTIVVTGSVTSSVLPHLDNYIHINDDGDAT